MAEIDRFLKYAVSVGASDLHLAARTRPMLRIHGTMVPASEQDTQALSPESMQRLVGEIMPQRAKEELQQRCDTDFAYGVADLGRFRVNVFRNHLGTGAVFRHIPSKILTFRGARATGKPRPVLHAQQGLGAGHRSDRQRQVDDAGGHGRLHQPASS